MTLADLILTTPILVTILAAIIAPVLRWQHGLSKHELYVAQRIKCALFKVLDPYVRNSIRPIIATVGDSDVDFVMETEKSPNEVIDRITPTFSGHLVAMAKKHKEHGFAHTQWVVFYEHRGEEWQTEVYLFKRPGGGTLIYAHAEQPPDEPREHVKGPQLAGDAHDKFHNAWARGD